MILGQQPSGWFHFSSSSLASREAGPILWSGVTASICKWWVFAHTSISNQVAPIIVDFLWRGWVKYHQKVINFHQLKTFNDTNDVKLFAAEMFQAVIIGGEFYLLFLRHFFIIIILAFVFLLAGWLAREPLLIFGHETTKKNIFIYFFYDEPTFCGRLFWPQKKKHFFVSKQNCIIKTGSRVTTSHYVAFNVAIKTSETHLRMMLKNGDENIPLLFAFFFRNTNTHTLKMSLIWML